MTSTTTDPSDEDGVVVTRARLIVVLIAAVIFTVGDGSAQLMIAPHLESRSIAPATIGPIVAAYSVSALIFRFVTGAFYRPRTGRRLIILGCVITSIGLVATARGTGPLVLSAALIAHGTGFAIVSTGTLAATMDLRRGSNAGVAMGIYTGMIGAGYSIANFLSGLLSDRFGTAGMIELVAVLPLLAALMLHPSLAILRLLPGATRPLSELTGDEKRRPRLSLDVFRVGPLVWLAFFAALHINLLAGVLGTYFPLYGLAIGLTFTQIGALNGISSGISSVIRFASAAAFARIPYRPTMPWMVLLGSLGIALFSLPRPAFWVFTVGFVAVGITRGVLRVASAALAMDGSTGDSRATGRATGMYMAGLDIGRIVAPVLGGIGIQLVGFEWMFLLTAVTTPLVYFAYSLRMRRIEGSSGRSPRPA